MPDATAAYLATGGSWTRCCSPRRRWRGPRMLRGHPGHLPLARLPATGNRPAHDPQPAFDPVTVFSHLTHCRCKGVLRG